MEEGFYIDPITKKELINIYKKVRYKDRDFVSVVDGEEGCLIFDTLIKTDKGIFTIKELNNKEFFVQSLDNKNNSICNSKATCFNSGNKEVFEIETEDGRKVTATKEHTFFVLRNNKISEVILSELKEGDKLICL